MSVQRVISAHTGRDFNPYPILSPTADPEWLFQKKIEWSFSNYIIRQLLFENGSRRDPFIASTMGVAS